MLPSNLPADEANGEFTKWEAEVASIEQRQQQQIDPGGVVFAGSSSVRLWDLQKSFPDKNYVNSGFGGSQIRECTHFVPRLVLPHRPRAVVFYAGDNDINGQRTAEQVHDDFTAFVAAIHNELPQCRILFVAIKPSIARWQQREVQADANARIEKMCSMDNRLQYVDIATPMLGDEGKPQSKFFAADGLHLSEQGYRLWTEIVFAALAVK
jgi:lysophospholipase L1-like esterase